MAYDLKMTMDEANYALCKSEAELKYHLICFGDYIKEREKYQKHYGIDAVYFYLIQKYSYTPSQVKGMNDNDLRFLLEEEMSEWTLPEKQNIKTK